MTTWDVETIPMTFTQTRAGHEVRGYPALVDEGASVAVRVLASERDQSLSMRFGTRRLLTFDLAPPTASVLSMLSNADKLALGLVPGRAATAVLDDCFDAAVDAVVVGAGYRCGITRHTRDCELAYRKTPPNSRWRRPSWPLLLSSRPQRWIAGCRVEPNSLCCPRSPI